MLRLPAWFCLGGGRGEGSRGAGIRGGPKSQPQRPPGDERPSQGCPCPPPGDGAGAAPEQQPPHGIWGGRRLGYGMHGKGVWGLLRGRDPRRGKEGVRRSGGVHNAPVPPPQPKSAAAAAVPAPDGGTLGQWKFCNYTKTVPRKWRQFTARLKSCILLLKLFQLICIFQPKCTGDGKIPKLSLTSR